MERTRLASWMSYLWPGFSRLWYEGHVPSLGMALAFATVLNTVVLASFVHFGGQWASWRGYGWAVVAAFWMVGVWQAVRAPGSSSGAHPEAHQQQDLLIQAQGEYLKGHWVEAQTLLEQLLRRDSEDIEARLLLASVFRRSRRIELSRSQLRRLYERQEAARWRFEIERELDLLAEIPTSGA